MDYLEDYYSNYWAQLLAAQTGQNTQTTTSANSDSTGLSFSDLLYSLSGVSGEDSASQMQNHLLSGVADGSIPLTDSHTFVSALLSTTGSDSGFGDTTSLLNSIDTSLLSPDTATALLDLNVSMEQDWMQKIVDSLSSANSASTNNEEETDPMQAYYQAMVAMTEAQKNMLLG